MGALPLSLKREADTCSLRSADKDESRRRKRRRDSAVDHMIFHLHSLLTTPFPITRAHTGEPRLLCVFPSLSILIRRLNPPITEELLVLVHLSDVCGFIVSFLNSVFSVKVCTCAFYVNAEVGILS